MNEQMIEIVQAVYSDLATIEGFCAETLADAIGDRMYDSCEEFRKMPYTESREMTLQFAQKYV